MKSPPFWHRSPGLLAMMLWPISQIYLFFTWIRSKVVTPWVCKIPVWCVGNITLGGSGKTPITLALARWAEERGQKVCLISKGYRGQSTHVPFQVNTHTHSAQEVGDESLLLAEYFPTIVGKNRVKALQEAEKTKASLLIMDDGYQNPTIQKSLHLLVIHSVVSLGNQKLFPAGPLREPVEGACSKADIILTFESESTLKKNLNIPNPVPVFQLEKRVYFKTPIPSKNIWAFCGLGNPDQFYQSLEKIGLVICQKTSFADHAVLDIQTLKSMVAEAQKNKLTLVCTAKDAVKIPEDLLSQIYVAHLDVLLPDDLVKTLTGTLPSFHQ